MLWKRSLIVPNESFWSALYSSRLFDYSCWFYFLVPITPIAVFLIASSLHISHACHFHLTKGQVHTLPCMCYCHHCAPETELRLSWKLIHMPPLTLTPLGDTPNQNSSSNPPLSLRTLSSQYPQRNVESCTEWCFPSLLSNYLLKLQNYTTSPPTNK